MYKIKLPVSIATILTYLLSDYKHFDMFAADGTKL